MDEPGTSDSRTVLVDEDRHVDNKESRRATNCKEGADKHCRVVEKLWVCQNSLGNSPDWIPTSGV